MSGPRHGLVLGKFYPPHAGHHLLVRTAARTCARVTVLVLAASWETIPLSWRVSWMREVHAADPNVVVIGGMDEVRIDYHDPEIWDAHMKVFAALLEGAGAPPVDAVFTSEAYGDELARRFSARHVLLDPARRISPVSGTAVRADPVAHWDRLAPAVRAGLARRVVIGGAESTGKTTFARDLRDALAARGGPFAETRFVPELGRDYTVGLLVEAQARAAWRGEPAPGMDALPWRSEDFVAIARGQNALEGAAARQGGPILVCDTDAFATGIWHERYLGQRAPEVEALADPRPSLHLLTHPDDVPFTQDGLRDGEHLRGWMTERFAERLKETPHLVAFVRGTRAERVMQACALIDQWLGSWRL